MLKNWKSSSTIALTALVGVTVIWGWSFLIVQQAVSLMPVMDFLAWRFTAAAIIMITLRPGCLKNMSWAGIWHGILLGVILGLAYVTQTYGLLSVSASVSGFITGMYVVLTPVIAWLLLKQKINIVTWLSVLLAFTGLALLSLHGWAVGIGELLTLGCALFCALHIIGLGIWSSRHDVYGLATVQIATVAVISLLASIPGGISVPPNASVWGTIAITAVFATALAFIIQTWAQSLVPATPAAVVMTMEPVFAGVFGITLGGNDLTWRIALGAGCVLAAMFMVQFTSISRAPKPVNQGSVTVVTPPSQGKAAKPRYRE
jgi:drug/metabolite transporter (DMT)-like permease